MRSERLLLPLLLLAGCLERPEIGSADCFNNADCPTTTSCEANRCVQGEDPGKDAAVDHDMAVVDPDMAVADPDMAVVDPDMAKPDPDMAVVDPDMAKPDPDMALPRGTCELSEPRQVYVSENDGAPFFRIAAKGDNHWGVAWSEWGPEVAPVRFQCVDVAVPAGEPPAYRPLQLGEVPINFDSALETPSVVWNGGGFTTAFADDLHPENEHHPGLRLNQVGGCDEVVHDHEVLFPTLGVVSTHLMHDDDAHLLVWEGGDPSNRWDIRFNRFEELPDLTPDSEPALPMVAHAGKPSALWNPHSQRMALSYGEWREQTETTDLLARAANERGQTVRGEVLVVAESAGTDEPLDTTAVGDNVAVAYFQGSDAENLALSFVPMAFTEAGGIEIAGEPRSVGLLDLQHFGASIAFDPIHQLYAVAWIHVEHDVDGSSETWLKVYVYGIDDLEPKERLLIPTHEHRSVESPRIGWGGGDRGFEVFWSEEGDTGGIFHANLLCP